MKQFTHIRSAAAAATLAAILAVGGTSYALASPSTDARPISASSDSSATNHTYDTLSGCYATITYRLSKGYVVSRCTSGDVRISHRAVARCKMWGWSTPYTRYGPWVGVYSTSEASCDSSEFMTGWSEEKTIIPG